jgi:hypothetical protein
VCPVERPDLALNFKPIFEEALYPDYTTPALDFLNQGGSIQALIESFKQYHFYIFEGDLTGDGIPEIAVRDMHLNILGCADGKYQVWLTQNAIWAFSAPEIFSFTDMNLDGFPDVVIYDPSACGMGGECSGVAVYEWKGQGFQSLTPSKYSDGIGMWGYSTVQVKDIDGNGTQELITSGNIPITLEYFTGGPWRVQTDTYMWNGSVYALYRTEYSPPEYRFQAVQDGDRATLQGEYDKAIGFYQQAIFSKTLKWWSLERHDYELAAEEMAWGGTPTPLPQPVMDPAEYSHLAAYARFRIMLLDVRRGLQSEARTAYDGLQMTFPAGHSGHVYAEMATVFWMQYQATPDIQQACAKVHEYAIGHQEEILHYLGDPLDYYYHGYHGSQSLQYQASDLCPFGE